MARKPRTNASRRATYRSRTSAKYDAEVSSAASEAIWAKVGGDNLAMANFIAAVRTSLFLVTMAPIRAPHML